MNPLYKTAVTNPTVRQEAERKIQTIPSPVVIQSSLASRIPTYQGSLDSPRSLSSYAVTAIAVESTEAKASRSNSFSSSSSSSRPSRIISSASCLPSPLVETHQGVQISPAELEELLNRSRMSEEDAAAVYRELEGRMTEVVNAATTTNPAQPEVTEQALCLLANLAAKSDARSSELWATLGAAGRAAVVTAATTTAQPAVAEVALVLLCQLIGISDVRISELWASLGAADRAAVVTAATNPAKPEMAEQALFLLGYLSAGSDVRKSEFLATFGAADRAAFVSAATNPAEPAVAQHAMFMLANLIADSDVLAAELWVTFGSAGRAAVVTAATSLEQPSVAISALFLLHFLTFKSDVRRAELWAALGAPGRATVVAAATNPAQPEVAAQAMFLLRKLTTNSDIRKAELWVILGEAGRVAIVAAATNPAQPEAAELALRLLTNLIANSDVRATELWATLGDAGRAAIVAAATNPAQPATAELALRLLTNLIANSDVRATELWVTLGNAGRAAVVAAATNPAQPAVAELALRLLTNLIANSDVRKAELWAALVAAGREGLIIAATTAGEPAVAMRAIELLSTWQDDPHINIAIWPLLQPRLTQLWAVTQRPAVKGVATKFFFEQIRGDARKTSQALNALNAAIPAISMRHTIATLGQWGGRVRQHEPNRLALLTGIVQANTSLQKMAVLMAAVMNGVGLRQRPQEWREALCNQVLAIPMAEGIDPTPYRQGIRLGFEAACGNTSAVLESPVLSAPEKLQFLEILYSSGSFLSAQATHEELSKLRLMPKTSRDFKLQAIGFVLNHGQASSTQFKEILTWLKGEFETDKHTVFTNPATLGDIGDEAIYALAEQRQQYLALYQNFQPHMRRGVIEAEIAEISQQVLTKEIPDDFGATLIFQLQQFLSTAEIESDVEDELKFDSKSESK